MNPNILPAISLLTTIILVALTGWFNLSESSAVNDATLSGRVATLELHQEANHQATIKLIHLEAEIRSIKIAVASQTITERELVELNTVVAVIEVKLARLHNSGEVNAKDTRDLQISLAKIVTLLKIREGP